MVTPEQSQLPCPICRGEIDHGECCGYEGTMDGYKRQEAAKIECGALAKALYPQPEPTALAMAISSAQTDEVKRNAVKFRREVGYWYRQAEYMVNHYLGHMSQLRGPAHPETLRIYELAEKLAEIRRNNDL